MPHTTSLAVSPLARLPAKATNTTAAKGAMAPRREYCRDISFLDAYSAVPAPEFGSSARSVGLRLARLWP